jgi:hypothetical protein
MADKQLNGSTPHKSNRTDALPHEFKGWGPQAPDPDIHADDENVLLPDDRLTWAGETDEHNHFIWRFDGRRRQHHH